MIWPKFSWLIFSKTRKWNICMTKVKRLLKSRPNFFTVLFHHVFLLIYRLHIVHIQAVFRTDECRTTPPTPQDEMRAGMSYAHETTKICASYWHFSKFFGLMSGFHNPYTAPLIQFSWMGRDRDDHFLLSHFMNQYFLRKGMMILWRVSFTHTELLSGTCEKRLIRVSSK